MVSDDVEIGKKKSRGLPNDRISDEFHRVARRFTIYNMCKVVRIYISLCSSVLCPVVQLSTDRLPLPLLTI